jgi:FKBP-type peptidyl-prolyl cis-trans isomerase
MHCTAAPYWARLLQAHWPAGFSQSAQPSASSGGALQARVCNPVQLPVQFLALWQRDFAWQLQTHINMFAKLVVVKTVPLCRTPTGLQYCDLDEGSGDPAKPGTLIRCAVCGALCWILPLSTRPLCCCSLVCCILSPRQGVYMSILLHAPGECRAHYVGSLQSNGKQFDSSYDRRRPLTFRVGGGEGAQMHTV